MSEELTPYDDIIVAWRIANGGIIPVDKRRLPMMIDLVQTLKDAGHTIDLRKSSAFKQKVLDNSMNENSKGSKIWSKLVLKDLEEAFVSIFTNIQISKGSSNIKPISVGEVLSPPGSNTHGLPGEWRVGKDVKAQPKFANVETTPVLEDESLAAFEEALGKLSK